MITAPGDVWICGSHRVCCGDALCPTALARLLEGRRAAMAFCDPQYKLPIEGFLCRGEQGRHAEFQQVSGAMAPEQCEAFLTDALEALKTSLAGGAVAFMCIHRHYLLELLSAARASAVEMVDVCVWGKAHAGPGSLYSSRHELVVVFRTKGSAHRNNDHLGRRGDGRSNVWTYRGPRSFEPNPGGFRVPRLTIKPVAMIRDVIRDVTRRNDAVLDLFLGSGSTLIAAHDTGRRCFGIEVNPVYVDVAVQRWQQHTGRNALHATTGATFNDILALGHEKRGGDLDGAR